MIPIFRAFKNVANVADDYAAAVALELGIANHGRVVLRKWRRVVYNNNADPNLSGSSETPPGRPAGHQQARNSTPATNLAFWDDELWYSPSSSAIYFLLLPRSEYMIPVHRVVGLRNV